jgi:hypothetical protein
MAVGATKDRCRGGAVSKHVRSVRRDDGVRTEHRQLSSGGSVEGIGGEANLARW